MEHSNVLEKKLLELFVKMVIFLFTYDRCYIVYWFFLGCTDGSVRLVGGQTASEGTIEICNLNLWGLISAAGWDNKDADVVCAQMGFKRNGKKKFYIHYHSQIL